MAHRYDIHFTPPFPRLPVAISAPEHSATAVLSGLIDTGADATLAPIEHLLAAQAVELYRARLRSHWGELRSVSVYLVDLVVDGHVLPGVEVVGDELTNDVLLGRNVLNRLRLVLDGPASEVDILSSRPRHR
jgi:predicted aspartyl protease